MIKDDVIADGIGQRVDGLRRLRSPGIGMHPHLAEVMAEAGLHEGTRRRRKRLTRGVQNLMHDGWDRGRLSRVHGEALQLLPFLLTLRTFFRFSPSSTAGTLAL